MTIKELETKIKNLEESLDYAKQELEKVKNDKKESKVWKPKYTEQYWYIYATKAIEAVWYGNKIDCTLYEVGNCFKTFEECNFAIEKLKVIKELKDFATENNEEMEWGDITKIPYYIGYSYSHKIQYSAEICRGNNIYFSSKEIAEKAVEKIGEERIKKYYLGIEE